MIAISVYSYAALVLIPTMSRTQFGSYRLVEPVEVLREPSPSELADALSRAYSRGNPGIVVPHSGSSKDEPLLVRFAKAKSNQDFEERASVWDVDWTDDRITVTPNRRASQVSWTRAKSGFLEVPDERKEFVGSRITQVSAWLLEQVRNPA